MKDDLKIPDINWKAHLDIQNDISNKTGRIDFIIKIRSGKITDYVFIETIDGYKGNEVP